MRYVLVPQTHIHVCDTLSHDGMNDYSSLDAAYSYYFRKGERHKDCHCKTHNSNESSHVLWRLISGDNFNNDMEISDTNTLL